MRATDVQKVLRQQADPVRAAVLQRFFKTGPGEYGAGDVFLGLTVPQVRAIARQFRALPLAQIQHLLNSRYHEERQAGLFILVLQYQRATTDQERKTIADFYLKNRLAVNNWDLVDASAPYILGGYYYNHDRQPIEQLLRSTRLWDRRLAVLASFYWLRQGDFGDTFRYATSLLSDQEDLIHKAVGWMLREIGKLDVNAERLWLDKHYTRMPRTMLRYAIEKFPPAERARYLAG